MPRGRLPFLGMVDHEVHLYPANLAERFSMPVGDEIRGGCGNRAQSL